MNSSKARIALICAFALAMLPAFQAHAKSELKTRFTVTIEPAQSVYHLGNPLDGEVIIGNTSMATLPGTFKVQLFHNDVPHQVKTVGVDALYSGTTKIDFKNFGIGNLTENIGSLGSWSLVIFPANHPSKSAKAEFKIIKKADSP